MAKEKLAKLTSRLKRKKDGSLIVSSKSHVAVALEDRERLTNELDKLLLDDKIVSLREEIQRVGDAINTYVLDHYEAGEGFESDDWLATKVVGHRRTWDVEKLQKLIPRGILKNVVEMKVIPDKIDEYVRKGKLDRKKIAAAFEEVPNKPYVRITKREQSSEEKGSAEAESLAAKLS